MEPTNLRLHEYQENAIDFALENRNVHMMLDMGLGKTAIALKTIQAVGIPALVIAPLRPCYVTWPQEIKKWTPDLSHVILHGKNKDTNVFLNANIYVMNYEGLRWFMGKIRSGVKKWKQFFLVLDESSYIKSPKTKRFKYLRTLDPLWSDYRMLLSATPAPNGLHELWPQFAVLDGGHRLGKTYYSFMNNHFINTGPPRYITKPRDGAIKSIKRKISDITYRLEAKDHINMPPIIYNKIELTLPKDLQELYDELEEDFYLQFMDATITVRSAVALSMKLRQFMQGAMYTDDGGYKVIHTIKVAALKEIMETIGQPILCPLQFRFEVEMIQKQLGKNIPVVYGGTKTSVANALVHKWNQGDIPLLLCHPRSLGHGVNLQTGGHIVMWYSQTWSLEGYQQLNGRLWRQGQKKGVVVSHLLFGDTIDETVFDAITQKDVSQQKFLKAIKRRGA